MPDSAGAQNRAQLHIENFRVIKTKPDRATTEKRIQLVVSLDRVGDFVAAEIECANDERMRRDIFGNLAVGFVLFVLRRHVLAIDVKKLGAIETDSFRAIGCDRRQLVRQLDIGREYDVPAITRGRFRFA